MMELDKQGRTSNGRISSRLEGDKFEVIGIKMETLLRCGMKYRSGWCAHRRQYSCGTGSDIIRERI